MTFLQALADLREAGEFTTTDWILAHKVRQHLAHQDLDVTISEGSGYIVVRLQP